MKIRLLGAFSVSVRDMRYDISVSIENHHVHTKNNPKTNSHRICVGLFLDQSAVSSPYSYIQLEENFDAILQSVLCWRICRRIVRNAKRTTQSDLYNTERHALQNFDRFVERFTLHPNIAYGDNAIAWK